MKILVLLALAALCVAQDDIETIPDPVEDDIGFALSALQKRMCYPLGYYADPTDCCWYIQCAYEPYSIGFRKPCMGGTVWDPQECGCVVPEKASVVCNVTECKGVPDWEPNQCPVFNETTGEGLLGEDQCCIDGVVINVVNETSFYVDGEDPEVRNTIQTCPLGILFNKDDCCCETGELHADLPSAMCDHFTFDDPNFSREGVSTIGARFSDMGASAGFNGAQTNGSISFSYGATGGGAYGGAQAKLDKFANVPFGEDFTFSSWVMVEGEGTSTIFHNGDFGGANATISMEMVTSGGHTTISTGVLSSDGVNDIIQQTTWGEGEWHWVGMRYERGELKLYLDDTPPIVISESADADDESIQLLMDQASFEAVQVATRVRDLMRNFDFELPTPDPTAEEVPGLRIQDVKDCLEIIKSDLDENSRYINDLNSGLTDFRSKRRVYRRAFNVFCRPAKQDSDSKRALEDAFEDVKGAFDLLSAQVSRICQDLEKVCVILEDRIIQKHLEKEVKRLLKVLKNKLKKLKGKFNDDNPPGDKRFGLRGIEETFPEAELKLASFDGGSTSTGGGGGRRGRRQTDDDDGPINPPNTFIIPSKWPITIGEDFNGSMDEIFVCDFALTDEQLFAMRDFNENPIKPDEFSNEVDTTEEEEEEIPEQ
ncbi:unnamed protein product [Owenia fusiformis]|uniref:Chitin-binding type-2 domain-containing protein n=2 Tax=Owenia fusiformis TaxID=6347 RepID=A0A8S4PQ41_OWEFU|nr:unnamed protein product [Owenia fusiformis]